jgi:hypothetical protein
MDAENQIASEKTTTSKHEPMDFEDIEADDPVVKEIDVYLARSLANKIYILQVFK